MRLIIISFITLVLFTSCSDKKYGTSETFIGAYRGADQMIPYPYILQHKIDSIYLFDNNGVCIDKIKAEGIKQKKELKFKEVRLKILKKEKNNFLAFDLSDSVNFRLFSNGKPSPKNSAKFEKIDITKNLDILDIKASIDNSIWKYDVVEDENDNPNRDLDIEKLIYFKNDSLNLITNYYYQGFKTVSEFETKAFNIFKIDSLYFLSLQKEDNNPQPIYQIINYNTNNIELKDFSSRDIKNIKFYKDSTTIEEYLELVKNTPSYSNCFDGYQGEYYFEGINFDKGNEYILNFVKENFINDEIKSGYIIVHFNINCTGNVGRFGLIQMDKEFKTTSFSTKIVTHLINKVSELNEFPPSNSNKEWLAFEDVHAFLMFKINNGKIVDICP